MGLLTVNSDFEKLWNEPQPTVSFDNSSYSLAGEVETELTAAFSVTDNYNNDVTDQCTITLSNDYVSIEDGEFVADDLAVGTYQTTATATYEYKSATVTATATINISVQEKQPTSISFDSNSYSVSGNEYDALTQAFTVTDDLDNDVTSLCSYTFEPSNKGLYIDGGYIKVDSAIAGQYDVTVTATYGQLTTTATVELRVTDLADSISFDSNTYTMTGTEGDTITQAFTVTDDLNNDVTSLCSYSFSPNDTGITASNGSFDASSVSEGTYSVTVTATYAARNLTTTATISMDIASAVPDYSKKYFTTEALENDETFTLTIPRNVGTYYMTSVSYSTDNGETWTTTNNTSSQVTATTPSLNQGDKVLWKGDGKSTASDASNYITIKSNNKNFNVEGNIMSLLYGDNYRNQTALPETWSVFRGLFKSIVKLKSTENLILPATTLNNYCYDSMFYGCTALTTAPELPATTLANYCYQNMFNGCTSLTTAPALNATTLAQYCYQSMFVGCTALTTAPALNATTLTVNCYRNMFQNCTSLTSAPTLPATTMLANCYQNMFYGCTSLTTAPALNATTLATYCYDSMFNGCTSLAAAPTLPATTLAAGCYNRMFYGTNVLPDCTNIDFTSSTVVASGGLKGLFAGTKVTDNNLRSILPINTTSNKPYLPVTTLAEYCYQAMFKDCTSLTTAPELPATTMANYCYNGMFNGCTSLTSAPALNATTLAEGCYGDEGNSMSYEGGMFQNCTSLATVPTLPATTMETRCYAQMFSGCTAITSVPANYLPATTVGGYCYREMFKGCTSLATAPELPATTLTVIGVYMGCYYGMFNGCTALTTAPELPATTLNNQCYMEMFKGCSNLNSITMLATNATASQCLNNWVSGVASSGTFTKAASMTTLPSGANGIPANWTVVDAS